jgi:hypothetical protein
MLLGIDGLNINSTENELGEKPSAGNNFDATLANKSDLSVARSRDKTYIKRNKFVN